MRQDAIRLFVGYDEREAAVYHAFCQSVIDAAPSLPVVFIPLTKHLLPPGFDGKRDGSNAFIYRRFLVPWLCNFVGWAMYADGDMIALADLAELWALRDMLGGKGVMVAKHDYRTKRARKYLGNANDDYPRKNWSSLMLWNCGFFPNRVLVPGFVAGQTGAYLHRFQWLGDDQVGDLPLTWNWLVGEYPVNPHAKLLHYTLGAPCFPDFADCDHAADWKAVWERAIAPIAPTTATMPPRARGEQQ